MVPDKQSVAPGTEVKFQVKVTGVCLQFQWKKDSKELQDSGKYCGTKTHTLRIKDVKKRDKGCYQCFMWNDDGKELSNEAELTVSKWIRKTLIYTLGFMFIFLTQASC